MLRTLRVPSSQGEGAQEQRPPCGVAVFMTSFSARRERVAQDLLTRPAGRTARFTQLRCVDGEGTACECCALAPLHGRCGRRTVGHLDTPQACGAAGVTVDHPMDCVHHTLRLKALAEVVIRHTQRKIPYKDMHPRSSSS